MRKKLFKPLSLALATAMLFSVSCQDSLEMDYVAAYDNAKTGTIKRSAEDAIEWALAYKNGDSQSQSRSNATANLADVKVITSATSRSNADTLIYVVNYDNNAGYALVSASCHVEPILGYVEEGSFDEERVAENQSYSYFLDAAKIYASKPKDSLYIPTKPIEIGRHLCDSIKPKLEVAWHQAYPEGYFFDNATSGCVQTATAQIMSYLELPTSITLTYPDRDKDVENINWNQLKLHKKSGPNHNPACPLNHEEHLVLARLCRQIGYLNNSFIKYGVDENGYFITLTGVSGSDCFNAFETLLPNNIVSKGLSSIDVYTLYDSLYRNKGIAMVGGGGHAWVCDGGRRDIWYNTFTLIDGTKEEISGTLYFHYNWGYGGQDNGYFLSTIFNPSKGKNYDDPANGNGLMEIDYGGLNMYIILKK